MDPINISHESLVFTQSYVDLDTFFVDANGKTCLVDFKDVGLLPVSFANYSIGLRKPFVVEVAKHLDWPAPPNGYSMAMIGAILCKMGDSTLGMSTYT